MFKAIPDDRGTLDSVPECYKHQQMCDKAVDNYPHALKFVFYCFMTKKTCDRAVDTHPSIITYVLDWCKTQKICDKMIYVILFNSVSKQ